jgi:serpin B
LDVDLLQQIRDGMQHGIVDLTMPRFEIKGETFSVKSVLTDLGMGVAFTPSADLSGMDGIVGSLMIHDVLHQAFVKVNEKGTEAAAATAVIVGDTSVPPEGPTVVLDRPFLFLIQDRPTGQVLFLGRLNDPR